ncbi:(deoxy)nucleoside triphosphate pyrophosphohydrolase [Nocardioides panacisoli]|uniref:8-oxo-dGTP diphosphatase n=1 Tax=Nocardioides panacisoli TaxID=627624 RepID=A0ABP7HRV8_9ACTN
MTQTVVGAILVDEGRVCAARRTYPPELAGLWEFPGGKVHEGETPAAALRRELREELAVEATIGEQLGTWPIDDRYELRLFLATITSGEPTPDTDHDEVRWLEADQLETVDWLPSDRAALATVARGLRR